MFFKKLIFGLIVAGTLLGLIEIAGRIFEKQITTTLHNDSPGWQTEFFADIMDWQESDPTLLWRFKAGLNGSFVQTDRDHLLFSPSPPPASDTLRIMILGDSSPVGMGLENRRHAFGDILVGVLNRTSSDRIYQLINASVPGYSSEQLKRWFDKFGLELKPNVVVVYAGNNDASISGKFTDRELIDSQQFARVRSTLHHLATYRILYSLLKNNDHHQTDIDNQSVVRVSPTRFAENLAAIATLCRNNRIALVIVKPPVPLYWPAGLQFKPFNNLTNERGELIMPEPLRKVLGQPFKYCLNYYFKIHDPFVRDVFSAAYRDSLTLSQTNTEFREAVESNWSNPILWNNLAVSFWEFSQYTAAAKAIEIARTKLITDSSPLSQSIEAMYLYNQGMITKSGGDTTRANLLLDSALQSDFLSLRVKRSYLEKIDSLAAAEYIPVLDLPSIFDRNGSDTLFVDHCHPTVAGHALIARSLVELMLDRELIER